MKVNNRKHGKPHHLQLFDGYRLISGGPHDHKQQPMGQEGTH